MVQKNLEEVRQRIEAACRRVQRDPKEVTLVAVSKTKPISMLQELCEKSNLLPGDIRWHMIGHLQRNKVKQVLPHTVLIHSVDSLRLAEQIETEAAKLGMTKDILLEVNVAEEESKY